MDKVESIYVAGKLSGNVEENKKVMIKYGFELLKKGYIIYLPYWTFDVHAKDPTLKSHDFWVKTFDFYWLKRCDAIFMLPNWRESEGAKLEHEEAKIRNKTIFYDLKDIPQKEVKDDH